MKPMKLIVFALILLLSVGVISSSFAEETLPEVQAIEQQEETLAEAEEPAEVEEPAAEEAQEPAPVEEIEAEPAEDVETVVVETPAPSSDEDTDAPEQTEAPTETVTPEETAIPEATDAPEETPVPEATEEPTAEPTEEPTAEPTAEPIQRSVEINMDIPDNLQMGDTVTLTATLIGYDDVNVALQWQFTKDGEEWFDAQGDGSTTLTYAFTVSEETAGTAWRLGVTIL